MTFKVKKREPSKKTTSNGNFEQYDDFDIDDCHKEQNRLMRNINNLERDKKLWVAANTSIQGECKKNLKHLVAKVEYLESDTDLAFYAYFAEKEEQQQEESRLRLFKNKK